MMTVMKDGWGFKRVMGVALAVFGATMIAVRAITLGVEFGTDELMMWLGFITVDALGTGGLTVAEKRNVPEARNETMGVVG